MTRPLYPIPAPAGDAAPGGDCPGRCLDVSSQPPPAGCTQCPAGAFGMARHSTAVFLAAQACARCGNHYVPASAETRLVCRDCVRRDGRAA